MNKNTSKIKDGIMKLAHQPYEITTGTVVAGSVDMAALTISVQPSDDNAPIEGVLLNPISGLNSGVILFPKDGSDVIVGTIDGPGAWVLLRAGVITSAQIKTANVVFNIDNTQLNIQNGSVALNISDSAVKINTASESLFQLLKDCFTYITELTVPTPSGTSGVPVNIADFTNLIARLNNLLAA